MEIKVIGTGSYVPERTLTNEDLEQIVETSDAWIRERTGIGSRRITEAGTTAMAVEAAKRALEMAQTAPEALDLIIVGTSLLFLRCAWGTDGYSYKGCVW